MSCPAQPGPSLPPAPASSLCPALSLASRGSWELATYSFGRFLAGALRTVEERAFTDVALTAIEGFGGGGAAVELFPASLEATTGADFELQVFDGAGRRVSFLVQAKALKLDQPTEGYPRLGDDSPLGGKQYARLLAACAAGGSYAGSAPLHVFYNGALVQSASAWPPDQCGSAAPLDEQARGITVARTEVVVAEITTPPVSYRVTRVAPVCWPLWCFFCCGITTLEDLAARTATLPGGTAPALEPPVIEGADEVPPYARAARDPSPRGEVTEQPPEPLPPARTVVSLDLERRWPSTAQGDNGVG